MLISTKRRKVLVSGGNGKPYKNSRNSSNRRNKQRSGEFRGWYPCKSADPSLGVRSISIGEQYYSQINPGKNEEMAGAIIYKTIKANSRIAKDIIGDSDDLHDIATHIIDKAYETWAKINSEVDLDLFLHPMITFHEEFGIMVGSFLHPTWPTPVKVNTSPRSNIDRYKLYLLKKFAKKLSIDYSISYLDMEMDADYSDYEPEDRILKERHLRAANRIAEKIGRKLHDAEDDFEPPKRANKKLVDLDLYLDLLPDKIWIEYDLRDYLHESQVEDFYFFIKDPKDAYSDFAQEYFEFVLQADLTSPPVIWETIQDSVRNNKTRERIFSIIQEFF